MKLQQTQLILKLRAFQRGLTFRLTYAYRKYVNMLKLNRLCLVYVNVCVTGINNYVTGAVIIERKYFKKLHLNNIPHILI